MANFTTEELQQMLNDKIQGETTASLMEISEVEGTKDEIYLSSDCTGSICRDTSKNNGVVYDWIQSDTVGKRVTNWMLYKEKIDTHGNTYWERYDMSSSISTNLTETYSQTGLIIEE